MTIRILAVLVFSIAAFSAFAAPATSEIDIAVLKTDVARGAVIAEEDVEYQPFPLARANASVVRAISDVAGKEARRALRAGELIRTSDLKRPAMVAKGSTVTMLFEAPGMRLTSTGRALTEGAEGETITVLNPTSFRKVEALVVKPGTVRVGPLDAGASGTNLAARRP
jgi:flagellar basal body P-ring formation protein FlgA